MKFLIIAYALSTFFVTPVFSQAISESNELDIQKPWKTLLMIKAVPTTADKTSVNNSASKIKSLIKSIDRIDIHMSTSNIDTGTFNKDATIIHKYKSLGYERIITVTITEIKQKTKNAMGEGSEKYLLKLSGGEYSIRAELICLDTGKQISLTVE